MAIQKKERKKERERMKEEHHGNTKQTNKQKRP